jgi:hypothetical protein
VRASVRSNRLRPFGCCLEVEVGTTVRNQRQTEVFQGALSVARWPP